MSISVLEAGPHVSSTSSSDERRDPACRATLPVTAPAGLIMRPQYASPTDKCSSGPRERRASGMDVRTGLEDGAMRGRRRWDWGWGSGGIKPQRRFNSSPGRVGRRSAQPRCWQEPRATSSGPERGRNAAMLAGAAHEHGGGGVEGELGAVHQRQQGRAPSSSQGMAGG
jgi:hypothetical protein